MDLNNTPHFPRAWCFCSHNSLTMKNSEVWTQPKNVQQILHPAPPKKTATINNNT